MGARVPRLAPMMESTVDGRRKSILITGCSSGIGLDAALTLRRRGWRVFAACRAKRDCDSLAKDHGLETLVIDYTKPNTIASGMAHVLRETDGKLDALFNNGAYGMGGATEDVPVAALREIFECNYFGWHDLTCRVVRVFRNQGGHGRIVQCSSILGNVVFPMRMAYSATKFALEAHCDSLRLELADTDIKVVSLNVGPSAPSYARNPAHTSRSTSSPTSPSPPFEPSTRKSSSRACTVPTARTSASWNPRR